MRHSERHRTHRTGWLRATVLGANDGIVSTTSLVMGVAAAGATTKAVLVAGVAGLVAGAMSMAAGEYVSVSSQADTEQADLARESKELAADPDQEHEELVSIYVQRGLDRPLASSVATQLMAHDALGAHSRDELGISYVGRQTCPGRVRFCRNVRCGCGASTADGSGASEFCAHVGARGQLAPLSCTAGSAGCARRRLPGMCIGTARFLLGHVGDGLDHRRRGVLRGICMRGVQLIRTMPANSFMPNPLLGAARFSRQPPRTIMQLPFSAEQFSDVFRAYNATVWPAQVLSLLPALPAVALVFVPQRWSGVVTLAKQGRMRAAGLRNE